VHSLPEKQWHNVRTIVLHEDFETLPHSVSYARGLIPFCKAVPDIRIERRIGLLDNILSQIDHGHVCSSEHGVWINGEEGLYAMVAWLEETLLLSTLGMPA
jgi:hypothetical protein